MDVSEAANPKSSTDVASLPEGATSGFRNLLEQLGEMHDKEVRALIAENQKLQLKLSQTFAGHPAEVEHADAERSPKHVEHADTERSPKHGGQALADAGKLMVPSMSLLSSANSKTGSSRTSCKPWRHSGRVQTAPEQQLGGTAIKMAIPRSESGTFDSGATFANGFPGTDFMGGLDSLPTSVFMSNMTSKCSSMRPSMALSATPRIKEGAPIQEEALSPNVLSMAAMLAAWRRRHEEEGEALVQAANATNKPKKNQLALPRQASVYSTGSTPVLEKTESIISRLSSSRGPCHGKPAGIEVEPWDEWTESKMTPHISSSVSRHLNSEAPVYTFRSFSRTRQVLYNHMILHPNSRRRLVWDLISCCLLACDVIFVPLVTGFELQDVALFIVIDWITLNFWTIDVFLSCITGFYKNGELQMQPKRVVKHYMLTWFFPDLLVLGIDWTSKIVRLMYQSASNIKVVRAFRIMRLGRAIRFLRLLKVGNFLQAIQDEISTETTSIFFDLATITFSLLAMAHVIGCLWHGIGLIGDDGTDSANSWLREHNMSGESLGMRYFTCLHWALSFFMSSMEVEVCSFLERVYTVSVLVLALLVFSSFLSMVTSSCMQLWNIRNEQRRQFWFLRRYLREKLISKQLAMRVEQYLKIVYESDRSRVHESQVLLLKHLSEALKGELRFESFLPFLDSHALFRNNNAKAKEIVNACFEMMAAAHDVIVAAGDQADLMLLMSSGSASYVAHSMVGDEGSQPLSSISASGWSIDEVVLQKYDWICEGPLWTPWVCLGTLEAKSICHLISIDSTIFREIAAKNYYLWQSFGSYAVFFCQYMVQKMRDGKSVTDLPDDDLAYKYFREKHRKDMPFALKTSVDLLKKKTRDAKNWVQMGSSNSSIKGNMPVSPIYGEPCDIFPSSSSTTPRPR